MAPMITPPGISEGPTLADLAATSGLEPRTIRSWIAQGLLPPPLNRGPSARYPADATQRLLAIVAMKDLLGMSLSDIRLELLSASAEKIAAHAARLASVSSRPPVPTATNKAPHPGAALDYLAALRSRPAAESVPQGAFSVSLEPLNSASEDEVPRSGLEALEHRLAGPKPAPPRRSRTEEWLRIPITPDLALSARGPLDPDQRARLERCASLIHAILLGS